MPESATKSFELIAGWEGDLCILTEPYSLGVILEGKLAKISICKSVVAIGLVTVKAEHRKINVFLHFFSFCLLLGTPIEIMCHLQLALGNQTDDIKD